jgi:hypothetical protein
MACPSMKTRARASTSDRDRGKRPRRSLKGGERTTADETTARRTSHGRGEGKGWRAGRGAVDVDRRGRAGKREGNGFGLRQRGLGINLLNEMKELLPDRVELDRNRRERAARVPA